MIKFGKFDLVLFVPHHEKSVSRVSDKVDTNQAVQPQKMARGLKFRVFKKKRDSTIY